MMEGISQVMLWADINADYSDVFGPLIDASDFEESKFTSLLGDAANNVLNRFGTTQDIFDKIKRFWNKTQLHTDTNKTKWVDVSSDALLETVKVMVDGYGWKTPFESDEDPLKSIAAFDSLFDLTFGIYFFSGWCYLGSEGVILI